MKCVYIYIYICVCVHCKMRISHKLSLMDISLPPLDTLLAGIFAILVFSYYLVRKSSKTPIKLKPPPEAGGAWPIIGHLHLFGGGSSKLPHIELGHLADKYGPIFTIRLGIHRTLVVSNSEIAKECFTTHDLAVNSRPQLASFKILSYDYAMFGFSPHGPYWREIRKIVALELLSNRRLELLKHIRAFEVKTSIKALYKLWSDKNKDGSGGHAVVEMKQWFGDLSLNIILRMVAGKRYFGGESEVDVIERRRCQRVMREFFRLLGLFVVRDGFPFLGWLDIGGHEKVMKKTAKELNSLADEWMDEHRRKRASGGNVCGEQDFMDVMLTILEGTNLSGFESTNLAGFDSDTINKATSMMLIAGGSDTTAVTLIWALSLILNNRHVIKKAQEELDLHIGKERLVNESDITNLVYLQAIVKETLRLHPTGPLSGHRLVTEACNIGGYHVPEGTRLMVNLWKIQTNPNEWADPHEFKPERFLTTHKDVDIRGQHFGLFPFGGGRRACPGISFGLQVAHLVIANLLHGFDIRTVSDEPVDMTETFGMTNVKTTPLEVAVGPRLSPSVYV